MASPTINVPIQHALQNVTLTVKITGLIKWRFQLWLATQLIKLAAIILNMGIELSTDVKGL
ncbi:MAG: hypothetical protein PHU08_00235 [Dehalococcoidales bacterium]|nr:hypothetical protein [Dehalococcoidales bacterium]